MRPPSGCEAARSGVRRSGLSLSREADGALSSHRAEATVNGTSGAKVLALLKGLGHVCDLEVEGLLAVAL